MRDKILNYLNLTGFSIDAYLDQTATMFRAGLERELPNDVNDSDRKKLEDAFAAYKVVLEAQKAELLNKLVDYVAELLPENVIDDACAFYRSPSGRFISEISGKLLEGIMELCDTWNNNVLKIADKDLMKIFTS